MSIFPHNGIDQIIFAIISVLQEDDGMASSFSLILGGAASGKSRFAEKLTAGFCQSLTYVATGLADDNEMNEKIRLHQSRRGTNWTTIEEPIALDKIMHQVKTQAVLIDCLTMWIMNLMTNKVSAVDASNKLIDSINSYSGYVVMVSGETGMGIVPDNQLSRQFCNLLGQVNQIMADQSKLVVLTVAGQPLIIKGQLPEWI